MAPKKYPERKEKVKVIPEEDFIPLSTLNKHKIEAKTVKLLKDSHIWNVVLTSNNRKSVLARIQGLTDAISDQIYEAVNKIMVSLKSDVDVFTEKIVDSLEKECHKEIHDSVRCCLLEAQVCAKNCYSFDEIHDIFHEKFGFDKEDTNAMYYRFFAPKKGHIAYKQLSSIRAAQRKAEQKQKQVGEEQAEQNEEQPSEQKEKQADEQKEKQEDEQKEKQASKE